MLSPQTKLIKENAEKLAVKMQHEWVAIEHFLYVLCDNPQVSVVLTSLEVDVKRFQQELLVILANYPTKPVIPEYAPMTTKALSRAIFHNQALGRDGVEPIDLLVAIMSESESLGIQLIFEFGITRLRLLRYLSHSKRQADTAQNTSQTQPKTDKKSKDALASYAINLNEKARQGKTDPLIGRTQEVWRCVQILIRRKKNNPLLVGDAGVGKTAIAEGLAWLIVHDKVPKALSGAVIYSLDVGALVAGTKFRGDFEGRMKDLLNTLKKTPNAILFIDEIHTVVGAGSSLNSSMDMSNLIKPALASGDLRCIGSTTFDEYRQFFEKDHALSRRFQKIDVSEPSIDEAVEILKGLKSHYEKFHQVVYTDDAIVKAVELSARHIHDRFLPDKAIDVIDEAGAMQNLNRSRLFVANDTDDTDGNNQDNSTNKEDVDSSQDSLDSRQKQIQTATSQDDNADDIQKPIVIDERIIEQTVVKIARIAKTVVNADDKHALQSLQDDLNQVVFGQQNAIGVLSDAILLSKAGLKDAQKPIGSFLFAGPTGVGKTEVCRQLALKLGIPLIRFDMSEYMESHTASRLIGAPPGYVGFDNGGLLTQKVHQNPHAVLLLDEIEKAHPDVFNLLLQVMDNGILTDNNGREVSFRQVILVMTTNAGASMISRNSMGFTEQNHSLDSDQELKKLFTPEFRNRLDAIVQFAPLDSIVIASVVDKLLTGLQAMLDDKAIVLDVAQSAKDYLAKKGYDKHMGARPMARLINDEIKKPLAKMILFETLTGTVKVRAVDDKIVLEQISFDSNFN